MRRETMGSGDPAIGDWIVVYLARLLDVEPETIDVTASFADYGVESTAMAGMTGDLIRHIGCKLPTACLHEFTSIESAIGAIEAEYASSGGRRRGGLD